jgi:Putative amidoligase enzyme/Gamma-glutamyl cyclotransferase, AIG2-like
METRKRDRLPASMKSSKKKTRPGSSLALRNNFQYGLELETLIYSDLLQREYETTKTASEGNTYAGERCGFLDFNYNNKGSNPEFISAHFRGILSKVLHSDDFTFEWYNGKLCPEVDGDFQQPYTKWAITYDGSVVTEKDGERFTPLYHRIEDIGVDYTSKLPKMIERIEIVSPPLSYAKIKNKELQRIFNLLRHNGQIQYFNCPRTSHHIHMSCGEHFQNPHVLYNFYVTWMIAEPLLLLSMPYWRRANRDYAESMYSAMKKRYAHDDRILSVYSTLINMKHNDRSSSLLGLFADSPSYFSRSTKLYDHGTSNAAIFDDREDKPIKVLASIFQDYIGKPDANGQFKQNPARYAALNCLNLLNANPNARTVEVRLKHGSDDPDEVQGYMELFTELAIVAIKKGLNEESYELDLNEMKTLLYANDVILKFAKECSILLDPKGHEDSVSHVNILNKLLDIFNKHIFNKRSAQQEKCREFMLEQIEKMRHISTRETEAEPIAMEGGAKREKTWVFCYGSNGMEQLRARVDHKGPWEFRPVVLKGYARIFSGYSGTWEGGVASIWPDPKRRVYGSIVKMTKTEIKKLDRYEGVGAPGWYYQDTFTVHDAITGEAYTAMGYVKEDMEMTAVPSIKYLESIELNLKAAGLKPRQVGDALKIYGIVDSQKMKVQEIGKWVFGSKEITFKSKRLAARLQV